MRTGDTASIVIELAPFEGLEDERVETEILLDDLELPLELAELQNRRFDLRSSRTDEISASVYLEHAHHPVELAELEFGLLEAGAMSMTLRGRILWTFEGLLDFADCDVVLTARLTAARR